MIFWTSWASIKMCIRDSLIVSLGLLAVEQMLPQKLGLFLNWEIYAFGAMLLSLIHI